MKKLLWLLVPVYLLFSSFIFKDPKTNFTEKNASAVTSEVDSTPDLYSEIDFGRSAKIDANVFSYALKGFENLKKEGLVSPNTRYLSVVDYSLSSNKKRLWIFDMTSKKVAFHSLVAHGKNTGDEFAKNFSNTEGSLQTSLGFFITENTYFGENGYSLKLRGMDSGFNDAAMSRAIVMHGADYVSENFAAQHKRIGRSWGCPAVPRELADDIINSIKGKNVLFAYYRDSEYLSQSKWLK